MLDLTGIMFSSIMMLAVIWRAMKLDSAQAWFPKVVPAKGKPVKKTNGWQRKQ